MTRIACPFLACLCTSFCASAGDGVIRFSGRIVEPPCTAEIDAVAAGPEINFDDCPMAAKGARIGAVSLGGGSAPALQESESGRLAERLRAVAIDQETHAFDSRYRLTGLHNQRLPSSGHYLVTVDYP